jgi:hypothetical protein
MASPTTSLNRPFEPEVVAKNYIPPRQPGLPQTRPQDLDTSVLGATTAPDPFAEWGGQDAYNKLTSGFDRQKENIYGTAEDAAGAAATSRKGSILDFVDMLQTRQRTVDERGVQNELGKKQGYNSILDMVSRGLRSGGTMLAGKNASDSSATEALAQAYGNIGQRRLTSDVLNPYAQEGRQIGMAQEDLERQQATGIRKFDEDKSRVVNTIVADARNSLAQLDAAMTDASLPEQINIESEKNRIKQQVLQELVRFDEMLGQAKVAPTSLEERQRTASELALAGTSPSNPFDVTTSTNLGFQGTPAGSSLPLFTLPRGRSEEEV